MNHDQVIMLQNFIKLAHMEIESHKECRDHISQRTMMYSYGRAMGAYSMIKPIYPDVLEKMKILMECVDDAMTLTIRRG